MCISMPCMPAAALDVRPQGLHATRCSHISSCSQPTSLSKIKTSAKLLLTQPLQQVLASKCTAAPDPTITASPGKQMHKATGTDKPGTCSGYFHLQDHNSWPVLCILLRLTLNVPLVALVRFLTAEATTLAQQHRQDVLAVVVCSTGGCVLLVSPSWSCGCWWI
jgi:hypothetical protein